MKIGLGPQQMRIPDETGLEVEADTEEVDQMRVTDETILEVEADNEEVDPDLVIDQRKTTL